MNHSTKECLYHIINRQDEILIIDVSNYLYRYVWAYKDLSIDINGSNVQMGHIYGFLRFVTSLYRTFNNPSIILALDGCDLSRREMNPNYKSNREKSSDVKSLIKSTTDDILSMLKLLPSIYSCYDSSFEADDCIGSIANSVSSLCCKNKINKNVYIMSNDKDMYQLVKDNGYARVNIIRKLVSGRSWKDKSDIVNENVVRDTFNGVYPKDLVKFRSIIVDSSDNLKGYYMFLKSKASVIATNFEYNLQNNRLVQKDGSLVSKDILEKYLPIINSNFHIFESNYKIMKIKDFDYEISPISSNCSDEDINNSLSLIKLYRLNEFFNFCKFISPYRDNIINS